MSISTPFTNPMLNPVILDTLFEGCYATPKEMCQYRLVCTAWHKASTRAWRRSFVQLTIHQDGISLHYSYGDDDDDDETTTTHTTTLTSLQESSKYATIGLSQFLGLIRAERQNGGSRNSSLGRKLFCNFAIYHWTSEVPLEDRLGFWRECGSWIRRLKLGSYEFYDGLGLDHLRDIIFRDTPNLQKLSIISPSFNKIHESGNSSGGGTVVSQYQPQTKLHDLEIYKPEYNFKDVVYSRYWPLEWNEIFTYFPNLKTLSISDMPIGDEEVLVDTGDGRMFHVFYISATLGNMLRAIVEQRRSGALTSLVNLKLSTVGSYKRSIVDLFREAALPLEDLSLYFESDTEEPVVRELLGLHAATLQKLVCTRFCRTRAGEDAHATPYNDILGGGGGVAYEHLTELELGISMAPNFSFLQYTPNLQKLVVSDDRAFLTTGPPGLFEHFQPVIFRPLGNGSGVVNQELRMTSLTEFETFFSIDEPEEFVKLTKWMPFISRLNVPLSGDTFGVVCTAWKDTLKELHFPWGTQIGDEELTGISPTNGGSDKNRPANITNLKVLEKFSHHGSRNRDTTTNWVPMSFTEHAVTHGFLLLPNLRSLQLRVDKKDTENVIRELLQDKVRHLDIRERRNPFE